MQFQLPFDGIQSTINLFWSSSTEHSWKYLVQSSVQKLLYLTYSLAPAIVVFLPASFSTRMCSPLKPASLFSWPFAFSSVSLLTLLLLLLIPPILYLLFLHPCPRYYNVCHALKNTTLGIALFSFSVLYVFSGDFCIGDCFFSFLGKLYTFFYLFFFLSKNWFRLLKYSPAGWNITCNILYSKIKKNLKQLKIISPWKPQYNTDFKKCI